ncbi:MAG: hypothetical protein IPF82_22975 [Blastocatellia bacterium]|nr:hypothetical protein [Blastocatellia bacterium]
MGRTENLIDPPLTEADAEALYVFYDEFLGKDGNDTMSFLKSVSLLRRGDLREYVHNFAMMRKRIAVMVKEPRHKDLLLSYPSTIKRVHQLLWEGQEAYGDEGQTVMTIIGSQAHDYLDQTEMFRVDLDSLLADCPSIIPEDRASLEQALAAGHGAFLFLLVALADHVFVSLLPFDSPHPTEAVLRTRTFLQKAFGTKFEDQIIEFFLIGGGYMRVSDGKIVVCGVHPVFDPVLADFGQPSSDRLLSDFIRGKYRLATNALRSEMPDANVVVQG